MDLRCKCIGSLNIDADTLPVRAVVSLLDRRLQAQLHDLLRFHPKRFQLGDIRESIASDFQNCFVYMAAISEISLASYKEALYDEMKVAKEKGLCRIILRVSNKINFSLCGFLGIVVSLVALYFRGTTAVLFSVGTLVFLLLIVKCSCYLLSRRNRLCSTDEIEPIEIRRTSKANMVMEANRAFEKICDQRVVLLYKISNIDHDFWNDENQQYDVRKKVAEDNGNNLRDVWLVKDVIPFRAILQSLKIPQRCRTCEKKPSLAALSKASLIPVIVPAKPLPLGPVPTTALPAAESDTETGRKELIEAFIDESLYIMIPALMVLEFAQASFMAMIYSEQAQSFRKACHKSIMVQKAFRLKKSAVDRLICAYASTKVSLFAYYGHPQHVKINMFVCYDHPQEGGFKDRLRRDLETLKEHSDYKILSASGEPTADVLDTIGKSDVVVVLWGDRTRLSENMRKEIELARGKGKPIMVLDGRSDTTISCDFMLMISDNPVPWNDADDIARALREI